MGHRTRANKKHNLFALCGTVLLCYFFAIFNLTRSEVIETTFASTFEATAAVDDEEQGQAPGYIYGPLKDQKSGIWSCKSERLKIHDYSNCYSNNMIIHRTVEMSIFTRLNLGPFAVRGFESGGWKIIANSYPQRLDAHAQVIFQGPKTKIQEILLKAIADGWRPQCPQMIRNTNIIINTKLLKAECHDLLMPHNPSWYPDTYNTAVKSERDELIDRLPCINDNPERDVWIIKSKEVHQGKGIFMVSDFQTLFLDVLSKNSPPPAKCATVYKETWNVTNTGLHEGEIVQKFMSNPFLIEGRKFHFRVMLLYTEQPLTLYYGFSLLFRAKHSFELSEIRSLLTNQHYQKEYDDPSDQFWTMARFQKYLIDTNKADEDYVDGKLIPQIKSIAAELFEILSAVPKVHEQYLNILGFGMLGLDFILSDDLELKFLEANVTPGWLLSPFVRNDLHGVYIRGCLGAPDVCQTMKDFFSDMPHVLERTYNISIGVCDPQKSQSSSFQSLDLIYTTDLPQT